MDQPRISEPTPSPAVKDYQEAPGEARQAGRGAWNKITGCLGTLSSPP